ncbi:hypothetical protein M513_13323 [Trichuris suis]|uniref:Uncharacterized protein n=1 Tax=Trichuris suis TaxID=68888 RepID=A0A085LLF2_9BILA|nr:hypothetical protein M513_13323 [Trichuris suis]
MSQHLYWFFFFNECFVKRIGFTLKLLSNELGSTHSQRSVRDYSNEMSPQHDQVYTLGVASTQGIVRLTGRQHCGNVFDKGKLVIFVGLAKSSMTPPIGRCGLTQTVAPSLNL